MSYINEAELVMILWHNISSGVTLFDYQFVLGELKMNPPFLTQLEESHTDGTWQVNNLKKSLSIYFNIGIFVMKLVFL